ncbi:SDR family NAD(P)-dependent oxidoreductase [Actinocrispum sp. NPDC049592]|uniref:SDR family NAD(P)-dependent oxidoreductase n=1 Tax=Actinocrispum sp. NPDC049592 TaxID=3154835 RepID=UPI00344962C7
MTRWDVHRLPAQQGKTFLVTGANAGIGYFVAEQLAGAGAEVVLAARSPAKAETAMQAIRGQVPDARLRSLTLDLGDLAAVRAIAVTRLDGIVLNAGVYTEGERQETVDGHELMYGTNHLGHFALAAVLYPMLNDGARIVTMSSFVARSATLDLSDLESLTPPFEGEAAYKKSKLAQTIFALELDRRLRAASSSIVSLAAHPGGALDGLTPPRPTASERSAADLLKAPLLQGKDKGAWPAVRALLDPEAEGGQLWGPRFLRVKGRPRLERPSGSMLDPDVAAELWTQSADAAGVSWKL